MACTCQKLRQLSRSITHYYDAELKKAGLKTTQYMLLSEILGLQPVSLRGLARAMHVEQSTLSRNLRPLKMAGWIEVATGLDGRSKNVTVTPLGRAKQLEGNRRWLVAQQNFNSLLSAERAADLNALADNYMEVLPALP
ncbi:MarR family winged helix-turn-helix transcriptional regulator [Noviherbaspirillum denitrificans]|uniref:HTH marR-type domain-containing protein n=1 Tax=Noviherbaspirillum denitrificans TaxID=1968433 RepID=A0A254TKU5_9BURK|nr:MarR family winged helix-turn-helix transcriptional regulator [Noviherbaspirillum denitrificans]OWW21233.1 hypothetical protein AYR66_18915 [Noviherbaspirillum denitrificans]